MEDQCCSSSTNTMNMIPLKLGDPAYCGIKDKLLVLDLDRTLCNFGKKKLDSNCPTIPRPYLHEFLTNVHKYYEIMLWSATPTHVIMAKLETLNMTNNELFKISYILTRQHMQSTYLSYCNKYKGVKPLSVIWDVFPQYTKKNTITVDDVPENFYLNNLNGLPIFPYEPDIHGADDELLHVSEYLINLAKHCPDYSTEDHANYKNYQPPT